MFHAVTMRPRGFRYVEPKPGLFQDNRLRSTSIPDHVILLFIFIALDMFM